METYLYLSLIAFLAFFLKGVTGTGPTTVIVSFGSLFLTTKDPIVLASFINVFGGLSMLRLDIGVLSKAFWLPICISMGVGSVIGAYSLSFIPGDIFEIVLSVGFLIASAWFILSDPSQHELSTGSLGKHVSPLDLTVGSFAGFCGGVIGINAPVLLIHFGRFLDRKLLRRLLVLLFLPSAILQTSTYAYTEMLRTELVLWGLAMIPCMALGIWAGSLVHLKVSERRFRGILGLFLIFASARLFLR